jgi:hypothetical protein
MQSVLQQAGGKYITRFGFPYIGVTPVWRWRPFLELPQGILGKPRVTGRDKSTFASGGHTFLQFMSLLSLGVQLTAK